jgi:colanic acid biosynthesis glycosyl transferase WcaI
VAETKDHSNFTPKKILLISHNYAPEPTGIGKVNGEMMNWLAGHGFDCTVITTYPYYPYWKVQHPYKNLWFKKEVVKPGEDSIPIKIYRCPLYVPSNPTGKKRMAQDLGFWVSMIWQIFKQIFLRKKFDLIISIAPPFHLAYLGLMLRKLNGGKLLYHIQDLQIDAAHDLNMLSSNKLFDYIYKIEKSIILKADYVSGISRGMIAKIKAKVERKVIYFPNWVDTVSFQYIKNRVALKSQWGYSQQDIIFLYSGAIGEKQGLDIILSAAKELQNHKEIKFIICGSGPYKEQLMLTAAKQQLFNIKFFPVQDKELFNEFLNMADYHLVLQKGNASDLVMPSKLATILAVGGVSIVTTSPGTSLYHLIKDYDLGYIVEPENAELLSELLLEIKSSDSYARKSENAREYATLHLNIDNVMNEFVKAVLS